jgi:glycosyltransferase involved in cell wall biosynthesis
VDRNPEFARKLKEASLVHAHFATDAASLLPSLRSSAPTPLIVSLHGYDVLSSDAALKKRGLRGRLLVSRRDKLIERATLFLCSSEYLRKAAIARGYPPERTFVHYIGHSVSEALVHKKRANEGGFSILFAGRFVENKGVSQLVPLSEELSRSRIRHHIRAVGAGPLLDNIRDEARAAGVPIEFKTPRPQSELHEMIRLADLVVVPSRPIATGESEALNLVALEAGALGTPVVANATGGIPEIVQDGVTGLLADPLEPEDLRTKVKQVLADDHLRAALRGPHQFFDSFSRDSAREKLSRIYEQVQ